jgi:hypothetical protein
MGQFYTRGQPGTGLPTGNEGACSDGPEGVPPITRLVSAPEHRRRIRSNNPLEGLDKPLKRRTHLIGTGPGRRRTGLDERGSIRS